MEHIKTWFSVIAVGLTLVSYYPYLRGILRGAKASFFHVGCLVAHYADCRDYSKHQRRAHRLVANVCCWSDVRSGRTFIHSLWQ